MNDLARIRVPLTGSRVQVRALEADDVPALYVIDSDADVKRFMNGPVRTPRDEWIASMASRCPSTNDLAVCELATGRFMGRAAMNQVGAFSHDAELQIVLGKEWWRSGYGAEIASLLIDAAFRQMGASKVLATLHPNNPGSLSLMKRFGFTKVGVVTRQAANNFGHENYELRNASWPAERFHPPGHQTTSGNGK